jgi:selenocysteine lyase/cysteine desulfurase
MLRRVYDVGVAAVGRKTLPWQIDEAGGAAADDVRARFGRLVGGARGDVAIMPSCSYAVSVAAHCLRRAGRVPAGAEIVVLEDQMSSNVYPWQALARETGGSLAVVRRPPDGDWTRAVCERIGGRTAVVALPNVHWCDGGLVDLRMVARRCAAARAALVVDATQSLGALPFDVADVRADFVMASSHKWLLGPYGVCPLYCSDEWQRRGEPIEQHERSRADAAGGRDILFKTPPSHRGGLPRGTAHRPQPAVYSEAFATGACRLDAGGRPNPILLPMLAEGLCAVLEWGPDAVHAHCARLCDRLAAWARRAGYEVPRTVQHFVGLRRLAPAARSVPTGAERAADAHALPVEHAWAESTASELKRRGVHVSGRFGALRVSPHVYNDDADIDALIAALQLSSEGPATSGGGRASGRLLAAADDRPRARL